MNADPLTHTVICERDIDIWMAASRVMTEDGGVSASSRSTLVSYARNPKFSGEIRVKAANMERNWTAYRLCWAHEPPRDRQAAMKELVGRVHQGAAKGVGTGSAEGTALVLASDAYGDYLYSLDPKFAVLKYRLAGMVAANTANFMDTARRENGRIMRNGVQGRKGEAPVAGDESPALPHPVAP